MKRKISTEEVRQFFETCIAQFDEAGLLLHAVRFIRDEEGKLEQISLNYSEIDINIHKDEKNPK